MTKKKPKPTTRKSTAKPEAGNPAIKQIHKDRSTTKSAQVVALLERSAGASVQEMMKATGWQAHSVRGFMAGSLKRQGKAVTSNMSKDGERRYMLVKES